MRHTPIEPPTASRLSLFASVSVVVLGGLVLAGCASHPEKGVRREKIAQNKVITSGPIPPGGGRRQIGQPYQVGDRVYVPREDPTYDRVGVASWYGGEYHHGTLTANGEVYDRGTISAAHPTLPLPSYARVTNVENGRSIMVRVNDRGPYVGNRIIDLSERTADLLGMQGKGLGQVRVQYVGPAGLAGSDQRVLLSSLRGPGSGNVAQDRTMIAMADRSPSGPLGGGGREAPKIAPAPTMVAQAEIPSRIANERAGAAEARLPSPSFQASLASTGLFGGAQPTRAASLAPTSGARIALPPGAKPEPLPVRVANTSAESVAAGLGDAGQPLSILPPAPVGGAAQAVIPVSAPVQSAPAAQPAGAIQYRWTTPQPHSVYSNSFADTTDARIAAAHEAFRAITVGADFASLAQAEARARPATIDLGRHAGKREIERVALGMQRFGTVVILPAAGRGDAKHTLLLLADGSAPVADVIGAARGLGAPEARILAN
jgi:rare lipoprotein A